MSLLDRLTGRSAPRRRRTLATDARAMRAALDALHRESARPRVDLRELVRDLLEGEIDAPTADVEELKRSDIDPDEFYERQVAPSWETLREAQRAARIEAFLEMCMLLDVPGGVEGIPADMAPSVRTRTLLLAWAFDETYGYLSSLAQGAAPAGTP